MPSASSQFATHSDKLKLIEESLAHLDHILPAQAPIQDFVHHNTLHGFQHLPFAEALAEAEKLTGIRAFLPEQEFRRYFQRGRIDESDLSAALDRYPDLNSEENFQLGEKSIQRKELYRLALLFDLEAIAPAQLNWQIEEQNVLDKVQADVPEAAGQSYLPSPDDPNPVRSLWEAICLRLDLKQESRHPEQLLDLNLNQTESWLAGHQNTRAEHSRTRN